jgi:hypothetical protein
MTALAGATFDATPIVLAQAPTEYVDVMLAAWALVALHSSVRFVVTADTRRLVPAALATGLLLGSKGTGLIWAAVLVAAFVVSIGLLIRARRLPVLHGVYGLVIVLVSCLALGSFWYIRNWVEHDNPVYPFRVSVAGVVLFDGPDRIASRTDPGTTDRSVWPVQTVRNWASDLDFWHQGSYTYEHRVGGLGPVWAWLGAPLLVLVAVQLARRRDMTTLAVAVTAVVFLLQPYRWWSRFTIPVAGLGAVAVALVASWRHVGRVVRVAALLLGVAGVALTLSEVNPASRAEPIDASDVLELVGKSRTERSAAAVFFHEYEFADRIGDDATVVVDLEAEPVRFVYPLFGDDLERRVVRFRRDSELAGAWVVTARGRQLDAVVRRAGEHVLVSDRRGVRAWKPTPRTGS